MLSTLRRSIQTNIRTTSRLQLSYSNCSSKLSANNFSTMPIFSHLELAPPDPILNTAAMYKADKDPKKVNLGIGAYRTNLGDPEVLPVVKKTEQLILDDINANKQNKEYLPIDGLDSLKTATQNLIFGEDKVSGGVGVRTASVQTLSGTGSLRVAGEFCRKHLKVSDNTIFYSDPTWGNHPAIFQASGIETKPYPYWDGATKSIKFDQMLDHFKNSKDGSFYLIHPCAHNPTGMDPSKEQWKQIIKTCVEKKHICLLDSAYQGYASGSLETDREVIRMFLDEVKEDNSGLPCLFMAQSFAKNLGLYGERIGMLHVVCSSKAEQEKVLSQLKLVIRPMYSSPPVHGALLVSRILNDKALYEQWTVELKQMADRINGVRTGIRDLLVQKGTPGNWDHITNQIGMFSFTGLSPSQCEKLIQEHHIYLLKSGRISLAGLNTGNLDYVASAMDSVVKADAKL